MKHDKHELTYKGFIKAKKRLDVVYDLQKALPYTELEKPYQDGWWILPDLRDDFSKDKRPIVDALIEKYSRNEVCKDPKKITLLRKNPSLSYARSILYRLYPYYNALSVRLLSEREYKGLSEQSKKYFGCTSMHLWNRVGNEYHPTYEINIPDFYMIVKIQKRIITHKREIDPILLQEEAELRSILEPYWRCSNYDGNYHYFEKRAERRQSKVDIKKLIEEEL